MWKRIAVATVAALTVLLAPVGSAQAEGACEFSIPQFPAECMSEEMYDYVTNLQADDLTARESVNTLGAENYRLRGQLWQQSLDVTAANQATSLALADRDQALAQVHQMTETVTALRTKVRVLKKRIKRLEAQLPHFVS